MSWVSLRHYSEYSILNATPSVEELAEHAAAQKMPALALTDEGNLFGAVEFFKACEKEKVKPIIGCELRVAPATRFEKKKLPGFATSYPLTLLAKNKRGYQNLCRLSSLAYLEGFYYTPRIDKELLASCTEGLLCIAGGMYSRIASLLIQGNEEEAKREILWARERFGEDFYLEVQRHRMREEDVRLDGIEREPWLLQKYEDYVRDQERLFQAIKRLSSELSIPVIATQSARYLHRADWQPHEILLNIQSGEPCEIWERDSAGNPKNKTLNPKREVMPSHAFHFKSAAEMQEEFADFPAALEESVRAAEKCNFAFDFKKRHYPVFTPPHLEGKELPKEEREKEAAAFLRKLCEEGVAKRYTPEKLEKVKEHYPAKDPLEVVKERLNYELDLIIPKGMCDYLLIVYDFIAWAKARGIPMGPGRGSGAGSIVLYLIGVTDIEPLRFNLFFERFINPERISYPDIDVDICMERRAEVIEYTVRKYGKEKVAQIITFGTMKAKMAIRDVARVLNIPLVKVNAIVKLVPDDLNITIEKALAVDPDLKREYDSDPEVHKLLDIAKVLEGSVRSTGIHAAGLIISADPIMEHLAICTAKDSEMAVTQFSMKPVEAIGMLKIDFLGLKTLTSIQRAVDAIHEDSKTVVPWLDLPLDNKATFNLLNRGKTLGIFQLESGGMQDLARQLHIDKFEEIIAVGALYRPGPMEMIPSFVGRKHGREPIENDHPWMAGILSETYGIMVYQEQVMQIASRLAGYSLGEGDVLRRAMGKKDREEMMNQREKFRTGALNLGIDETTSMRIFDKVEKFASYGFNKSHAAAYGYLTYVTAYLKANHPREWMAALMTSDRGDTTSLSSIIAECRDWGIPTLSPDVNESGKEFTATTKGIRFAMSGIKGVGEGVVEAIVEERKKRGPFESLYDFITRLDAKKVPRKAIEILIDAGSFDFTGWAREALMISVEPMLDTASRKSRDEAAGVLDLFASLEAESEKPFSNPPFVQELTATDKLTRLKREKELLGFYLTGHPLEDLRPQIERLSCIPLTQVLKGDKDAVFRTAFIVEEAAVKLSNKSQRKFAILTISDGQERCELPLWPDRYEEQPHLASENQLAWAVVQVERGDEGVSLQCRWIGDLLKADETARRASDQAYDKAKLPQRFFSKKEGGHANKPKEEKVPKELKTLCLKLDIEAVRLSHILEIKRIFRAHAGGAPVQIRFSSLGLVDIGEKWGVQITPELEAKLRAVPSLQELVIK